jgi:glycosyltransferase involved in cell wall biosynthesis
MITILMATYNGEAFLPQQLESLLGQTVQDFTLYVRDDGSSDSTLDILRDYSNRYPSRITVSGDGRNSGGTKHNFMRMMTSIRDDYLMLCDQDDVWFPDKIEKTLTRMKETEAQYGVDTPVLVHTDLRVVDANLEVINPSFRAAMNANYSRTRLKDQVIQNTLTGCTAMYNRALAELLIAEPPYMVMHDWWLILVASAFGTIAPLEDQTILYRQHGANQIGAKDVRTLRYKLARLRAYGAIREAIRNTYPQADGLLELYRDRLSPSQIRLLEQYRSIPEKSKLARWLTVCKLGTWKNGLARNIAYFLFL